MMKKNTTVPESVNARARKASNIIAPIITA